MDEKNVIYFNNSLKVKGLTIVCAESITAGLLASTMASISGASDILLGSIVTYSRELKSGILKVDPRIIDVHTAESMETTVEMVYGLVKVFPSAKIHLAVTGVASESPKVNKPLGQVYIAIYFEDKIHTIEELINYDTDESSQNKIRNQIRENTVKLILKEILNIINSTASRNSK